MTFRDQFDAHDWSRTPLGSRDSWPALLRTNVEFILATEPAGFITWGADHAVIFNEAFAEIMGDRYAEALGHSLPALWSDTWHRTFPYFSQALAGRGAMVRDQPFPTWASGYKEMRYFTFSYVPLRDTEQVHGTICLCADTTDQVQAQERLQGEHARLIRLFEDAPGFLGQFSGPDHRYVAVNAAYRRLVGRSDIIGKPVAEALPELAGQGFIDLFDQVIRTGERIVSRSAPVRLGDPDDERLRYIDFVLAPLKAADGSVEGILFEGQDVTDHVLSQQRIEELQKELIHFSRVSAMGTMASALAHELNQPLAAASSYLNAARRFTRDGTDPAGAEEAIAAAGRQILKAGEIIRRLRAMVANRDPKREWFDVRVMLADAVALTRAGGGGREAAIDTEVADDAVTAFGDQIQVEQVLMNLMRNALDAMKPQPGRHLSIAVKRDGASIRFAVTDNGPGFGKRDTDPFAAFSTTSEGLGLGLAISRTIVETHGGSIEAEDVAPSGARVTFTLPLPSEEPAAEDA